MKVLFLDELNPQGYSAHMQVTLDIPDDLAQSLNANGEDFSRRVIEALAAEEYRNGRITKPQLRQALGIQTSYELDGFLKSHQVWIDYDEKDLAEEQKGLERLGL